MGKKARTRTCIRKSEAILLTGTKRINHVIFNLDGVNLSPKGILKYLGITINKNLMFVEHTKDMFYIGNEIISPLSRSMPKVGVSR